MATYKNIRIKMKGGKTRLQRVMVLASGKYRFVKNLTKSRVKKTKTSKKTTRKKSGGKNRKMGKRKFTLPLAVIGGLSAGLARPVKHLMAGEYENAMTVLSQNYTGWSIQQGNWDAVRMKEGLLPLVIGALVHKFVGGPPINLNRMLASAGVPLIRI